MPTTGKGYPYPDGSEPAADLDSDIQALAEKADENPGIAVKTTAQRDGLAGGELWEGRVIWNDTTNRLEVYNGASWAAASSSDVIAASLIDAKGDIILGTADNTPARKAVGSNGQLFVPNSANGDGWGFVDFPEIPIVSFSRSGVLTVATGTHYFPIRGSWIVTGVKITVDTAPTGQAILVDIHKVSGAPGAGATLFTTQGNRPSIAASGFDSGFAVPDVTALADDDFLRADIDQIGSGTAGSNITTTVYGRPVLV